MNSFYYNLTASSFLNANLIFFLFLSGYIVVFTVFLLIKLLSKKKREKLREGLYFFVQAVLFLVECAVNVVACKTAREFIFFALLNITAVLFLFVIFAIAKRKNTEILYESEDENTEEKEDRERALPPKAVSESIRCAPVERESTNEEIDFSHVKNIMERLEYFSLSAFDKRQVSELKEAVYSAENYGISDELREKINDGLGMLLKIMSKYGV